MSETSVNGPTHHFTISSQFYLNIFNCNNFLPKFVLIIETTISISVWLPSALSLCWCVSWLHIWRVQMMRSDHYKIFRGFIPFWITIKTDHKLRAYTTIVVIVSHLLSPVLCLVFVCIYLFFWMLCLVPFCHSFVARPYLICHACILYTNGVDAIDNYDSTDIHTVYLVARILFILILCLRLRLHTQTHTQLHDTRAVVMALQRPRRTNIVYTLYSTHGSMQDQTAVLQSKFCVQYTYSDAFFSLAFALSLSPFRAHIAWTFSHHYIPATAGHHYLPTPSATNFVSRSASNSRWIACTSRISFQIRRIWHGMRHTHGHHQFICIAFVSAVPASHHSFFCFVGSLFMLSALLV